MTTLKVIGLSHQFIFRYDEKGNTPGKIEIMPPAPTRLAWDFKNEQLLKTIDDAYDDAQKVLNVSSIKIIVIS